MPVVATYNDALLNTSLLFQTRFWAGDVNTADAVFSDLEVLFALFDENNIPKLAAASLCEAAATDMAKITIISRTDTTNIDASKIAPALKERAERLRKIAPVKPITDSTLTPVPDKLFSMGNLATSAVGTMDGW